MSFPTNRLNDGDMKTLFNILLEGLGENARLDEKKKIVNSILPLYKYKMLYKFLFKIDLSEVQRLNCLPIFLDKRTKFFNFIHYTTNQTTIKSILEIIPKYCPNIVTVDLKSLYIQRESIENLITFLKQTTQMKCLRILFSSAMYQLFIEEDFHTLDPDVQSGLLKIVEIEENNLNVSNCIQVIKRLPNLVSLGNGRVLGKLVSTKIDNDKKLVQKLSMFIELHDVGTSLNRLKRFGKFFPNITKIHLINPNEHVIENITKFPLITILILDCKNSNQIRELIELLKIIGKRLLYLDLLAPSDPLLDPSIILPLCPRLYTYSLDCTILFNYLW